MADKANPFADIYSEAPAADNPFAGIYEEAPKGPSIGAQVWDVAKQIPTALVTGTEAIPQFPGHAASFLGGLVEKIPGMEPSPEEASRRKQLLDITAKARGGGIADYLPKAQTPIGQSTRNVVEFIPAMVSGGRAGVGRLVAAGGVTGLASEAAGQATAGTAAEPYARGAAALVAGPAASLAAERSATQAALRNIAPRVERTSNQMYDDFRNAGFTISPRAAPDYAGAVRNDLNQMGMTPVTADRTHAALDAIAATPFTSPADFQAAYKQLGSVARKAKDSEERAAANIAQQRLLTYMENIDPAHVWQTPGAAVTMAPDQAVGLLREANQNWGALQRASSLDRTIARGEQQAAGTHSGLNLENELRRRVGVLGRPEREGGMRGASDAERARLTQFGAEPYFGANPIRYMRNLLGGGGGLGSLAAGVAGVGAGGAGTYFGIDPLVYGGATMLTGLGLAKYSNARALNAAREIQLEMLRRAPAAGRPNVPPTLSIPPSIRVMAPTLSTIGEQEQ